MAETSPPRFYSDGTVDVDVVVPMRWLAGELRTLHRRYARDQRFGPEDFDRLATRSRRLLVIATGTGTLRDMQPAATQPAGDATPARPPGWEQVTPQGIFMARRAAELDAYRRLTSRIGSLEIDDNTVVNDILAYDPGIRLAIRLLLEQQRLSDPVFEPDRGCTVTAEVPVAALVETLNRAATRRPDDGANGPVRFDGIRQRIAEPVLRAQGHAFAPPRHVRGPSEPHPDPAPPWAARTLRAAGQGAVPEGARGTDRAESVAEALAFAQAHADIARQLDAFPIDDDVTVQTLIRRNQLARADIATYLMAVRKTSVEFAAAGTAHVVVEPPLERLWRIVRRHTRDP